MSKATDPVRDRIIEAALRAIDDGGPSALRIVPVAQDAGVSQGMIRYYFHDREGLVEEALAARFRQRFGEHLEVFASATAKCETAQQFRAVIAGLLDAIFVSSRTSLRLERNSDVGVAASRPSLAARIAERRNEVLEILASVVIDAQNRGLMRADIDPLAVAALHLSVIHGYSLWELGDETISPGRFVGAYRDALFALMFD